MSNIEVVNGSQLPEMPNGTGNSEKLMLFGIRNDTGATVLYHLTDLIEALEDGEYIPALAGDLNIASVVRDAYNQGKYVETTGGTLDVNSAKKAYVTSVRGTNLGIGASGTLIRSVGFNQIKPSGISGQSATFMAVACAWGEYGKNTENNGYLFTNADGEIVIPISIAQGSSAVPTHTYNDVTYYLPSGNGDVTVTFASGVDVSEICAHLCWSNYRDNEYAEYSQEEISLQSVITAAGGTLRRVTDALGRSVYDEIVLSTVAAERQWYRRVGVVQASTLSWAVETITTETTDGTTTKYRFSATVSGMKENGVYLLSGCSYTNYVNGNVLMIETDSVSTVADLQSVLGDTQLKYELATAVTGTHSLTGELTVDDFGTILMIAGSEVEVDFDIEFAVYWRDVVKNTPTNLENDGLVTAMALVNLEERIARIERGLSEGLSKLVVEKLEVKRAMSAHLVDDGTDDAAVVLYRAGAPTAAPVFVGQRYINSATGDKYTAKGVSAATDWQLD